MHEVSLMSNVLETVTKAAEREGGGAVAVIHLRIGEMAGVSVDALAFAFGVLKKGTIAEGGRLEFERIPFSIDCRVCGVISKPEELSLKCSECGSPEVDVRSGREMEVDYILLDDDLGCEREDPASSRTGDGKC